MTSCCESAYWPAENLNGSLNFTKDCQFLTSLPHVNFRPSTQITSSSASACATTPPLALLRYYSYMYSVRGPVRVDWANESALMPLLRESHRRKYPVKPLRLLIGVIHSFMRRRGRLRKFLPCYHRLVSFVFMACWVNMTASVGQMAVQQSEWMSATSRMDFDVSICFRRIIKVFSYRMVDRSSSALHVGWNHGVGDRGRGRGEDLARPQIPISKDQGGVTATWISDYHLGRLRNNWSRVTLTMNFVILVWLILQESSMVLIKHHLQSAFRQWNSDISTVSGDLSIC